MKTSELSGAALDWAVAKCECGDGIDSIDDPHFYSTDWAIGGPIVQREKLAIVPDEYSLGWVSHKPYFDGQEDTYMHGPTPLVAAMRCYVASLLGDEVQLPQEVAA